MYLQRFCWVATWTLWLCWSETRALLHLLHLLNVQQMIPDMLHYRRNKAKCYLNQQQVSETQQNPWPAKNNPATASQTVFTLGLFVCVWSWGQLQPSDPTGLLPRWALLGQVTGCYWSVFLFKMSGFTTMHLFRLTGMCRWVLLTWSLEWSWACITTGVYISQYIHIFTII